MLVDGPAHTRRVQTDVRSCRPGGKRSFSAFFRLSESSGNECEEMKVAWLKHQLAPATASKDCIGGIPFDADVFPGLKKARPDMA
jgi:hypothetical protein